MFETVDCNLVKLFLKSIDLSLLNSNNEFVKLKTCLSLTLVSQHCLRVDFLSLGDDYQRPSSYVLNNDMIWMEAHLAGIAESYMIYLVAGTGTYWNLVMHGKKYPGGMNGANSQALYMKHAVICN